MTQNFAAIILAAGKGTRMKSALPKVLHEIAGRPMLGHALAVAAEAGASDVLLVTAPDQDAVRDYADKQDMTLTHAIQEQQLGTGDAVRVAFAATDKHERFLVMFGDTPLMRAEVLAALDSRRPKKPSPHRTTRVRPKETIIYDDFGEPIRRIWQDK